MNHYFLDRKQYKLTIFVFSALISSLCFSIFLRAEAKGIATKKNTVVVDGIVEEHITYKRSNDIVTIGTNYKSGVTVFNEGKVDHISVPSEESFLASKALVISASL